MRLAITFCLFLICAPLILTGCGLDSSLAPAPTTGTALQGRVFGGQQPVIGAVMQLYAVGNSGNGSAATPLISSTVTTGAGGSFSITGDYTCPSGSLVYLTATGGNPGLSGTVNNTALALVDALGPCSSLNSSTHIIINEATTVAAAWALSPFAASITNIGSSSTNTIGITNAFVTAAQLADPFIGQSPGSSAPAGTYMESAKLYSLADVISSCVNSNGSDANCSSLFSDVTAAGGATPTDTFGAALSVVKNPGNNVAGIFTNHIPAQPPFVPLASAPNDWTISITYTGTGSGSNIAFDSQSNLWMYSGPNGDIVRKTRQGTQSVDIPIYPYSDGNYYVGAEFTIDSSDNIWVANSEVLVAGGGTPLSVTGTVFKFNSSGTLLSGTPGYTNEAGIFDPQEIAADSNGNIWLSNSGTYQNDQGAIVVNGGDVALVSNSGAAISPGIGYGGLSIFDPGPIAIDGNHKAWFNGNWKSTPSNFLVSVTTPTLQNPTAAINQVFITDAPNYGIAVDTSNAVWFLSGYGNGQSHLGEISNTGNLVTDSITGGGLFNGTALAIDAANHIWANGVNPNNELRLACYQTILSEFSGSGSGLPGTPLTPGNGFGRDVPLCGPTSIAIDSSGSIWLSSTPYVLVPDTIINVTGYDNVGQTITSLGSSVGGYTTFVGLAAPVKTPLLGPPQAP